MNKTRHSAALTGDVLTDDQLDRLATLLEQFPEAMNLETMDGFFAALICAPETVPMGEVFAQV
jgi:uncharacterized protein